MSDAGEVLTWQCVQVLSQHNLKSAGMGLGLMSVILTGRHLPGCRYTAGVSGGEAGVLLLLTRFAGHQGMLS